MNDLTDSNILESAQFAGRILYCNHSRKLKKKCTISLVAVLILTMLFHAFGGEMIWSSYNLSANYGITFNDYDSFIEYMEQDIPYDSTIYNYNGFSVTEDIPAAPESAVQYEGTEWFDSEGNPITEEEALTRTIEDANGNVVCTYIERNQNVSSIRYSAKDGTVLPIQVITTRDYRSAASLSSTINTLFCVIYPIEFLIALLIYFKKRAK